MHICGDREVHGCTVDLTDDKSRAGKIIQRELEDENDRYH